MTVPVLQVKNLYKLFIPLEHSQNEKKAMSMLEQGASRTEVQEATGITAGLIDINLSLIHIYTQRQRLPVHLSQPCWL